MGSGSQGIMNKTWGRAELRYDAIRYHTIRYNTLYCPHEEICLGLLVLCTFLCLTEESITTETNTINMYTKAHTNATHKNVLHITHIAPIHIKLEKNREIKLKLQKNRKAPWHFCTTHTALRKIIQNYDWDSQEWFLKPVQFAFGYSVSSTRW